MFKRLIASLVCFTFSFSNLQYVHAQPVPQQAGDFSINQLPVPGSMIFTTPAYVPLTLKGLIVHPENALKFDFLMDTGNSRLKGSDLSDEALKIMKYFLTALTIPENDLWVNLSPYEKGRIIQDNFGQTIMGRDLLAQDYILKQLIASLIYPEKALGKEFWRQVYSKATKEYGTTQIPVNTFNKVWIVPSEAVVWEHEGKVLIVKSRLKVMLEEDYLAFEKNQRQPGDMALAVSPSRLPSDAGLNAKAPQGNHFNAVPTTSTLASRIVRAIVLPVLEKEVNEGKNFAQLRQMYQAMILATWYKKALKESIFNKVYANKKKIAGIGYNNFSVIPAKAGIQSTDIDVIYQRYLQAFKKGAFNYIKEDIDPSTGQAVPRKYFSGGFSLASPAMISKGTSFAKTVLTVLTGALLTLSVLQQQAIAQAENGTGKTIDITVTETPIPGSEAFNLISKDAVINGIQEARARGRKFPVTVEPNLLYSWSAMIDDTKVLDALLFYLKSFIGPKGENKLTGEDLSAFHEGIKYFLLNHPGQDHYKILEDLYRKIGANFTLGELFTIGFLNDRDNVEQRDCLLLWDIFKGGRNRNERIRNERIREEILKVYGSVIQRDTDRDKNKGVQKIPDAAMQSNNDSAMLGNNLLSVTAILMVINWYGWRHYTLKGILFIKRGEKFKKVLNNYLAELDEKSLMELLRHKDLDVRSGALRALKNLGIDEKEIFQKYRALLLSASSEDQQLEAVDILGKLGNKKAIRLLQDFLDSRVPELPWDLFNSIEESLEQLRDEEIPMYRRENWYEEYLDAQMQEANRQIVRSLGHDQRLAELYERYNWISGAFRALRGEKDRRGNLVYAQFETQGMTLIGREMLKNSSDKAMLQNNKHLGGIALNAKMLDLKIRRDGNGVPLALSQQPLDEINIQGFVPQIISIQPVDLPALFGLSP
jgi:hypothetical protein